MQTPRFSGQPINAGDFVFTRTFSRPIRTSCENVGTVVLFLWDSSSRNPLLRKTFRSSRKARAQNYARAHNTAERFTANPEKQARNPVCTPEGRTTLLISARRGLLGFSGLAPHSGRSSVPIRRSMFRDRRLYPSN